VSNVVGVTAPTKQQENGMTRVIYTNKAGKGVGTASFRPWGYVVIIREDYKKDKGLLNHELFHARGNLLTQWRNWLIRVFDKEEYYEEEVDAFAIQLHTYYLEGVSGHVIDSRFVKFANFIREKYGFKPALTKDVNADLRQEVMALMREGLPAFLPNPQQK